MISKKKKPVVAPGQSITPAAANTALLKAMRSNKAVIWGLFVIYLLSQSPFYFTPADYC